MGSTCHTLGSKWQFEMRELRQVNNALAWQAKLSMEMRATDIDIATF